MRKTCTIITVTLLLLSGCAREKYPTLMRYCESPEDRALAAERLAVCAEIADSYTRRNECRHDAARTSCPLVPAVATPQIGAPPIRWPCSVVTDEASVEVCASEAST